MQVTACKTSQEAIQVLKAQQGPGGAANFDLVMKEHCPSSGTNTTRFLRRAQNEQLLQGIPVIGKNKSSICLIQAAFVHKIRQIDSFLLLTGYVLSVTRNLQSRNNQEILNRNMKILIWQYRCKRSSVCSHISRWRQRLDGKMSSTWSSRLYAKASSGKWVEELVGQSLLVAQSKHRFPSSMIMKLWMTTLPLNEPMAPLSHQKTLCIESQQQRLRFCELFHSHRLEAWTQQNQLIFCNSSLPCWQCAHISARKYRW